MPDASLPPHDKEMPLSEHLRELRDRVVIVLGVTLALMVLAFPFSPQLVDTILAHVVPASAKLTAYEPLELFKVRIIVCFLVAIAIGFPLLIYEAFRFAAPGLYRHEKRAFLPFLLATPILFIMGAALAYYVIMPLAWHFFLQFQHPAEPGEMALEVMPKVNEYLSLVMHLLFGFGLAFEMPVALALLARANMITAATLRGKRRYAVLIVFIVAAILTPPDIISQCSLAIPLLILYEVSILIVRSIDKQRAAREAAEEAEAAASDD